MLRRAAFTFIAYLLLTLPAAAAGDHYGIYFKNKCSTMIQVSIRYKDTSNNWVTKGWYNINAGEEKRIARSYNAVFYYFAQARGRVWSGKDRYYQIRDEKVPYGFRRKEISGNQFVDHTVSLSCTETFGLDPLHFITIVNDCDKTAQVYLRYETVDGSWNTTGWFTVKPNERKYLKRTQRSYFYYYAKHESGQWSGDHPFQVKGGQTYNFLKVPSDKRRVLTCRSS
ncbi:DUF1036 domain-containing protein [Rhodobacteraceae bacterium D3-12]|nr:DUF1036 domain-containing protein [Rhodobacteraceae bacterium D3-12]